jgi:glycogen(starch) synthase
VRVLVLTNMFPPHAYGGYELSCRDVVASWQRAGHEVTVLTSTWRLPPGTGHAAGSTDGSAGDPEGGVAVRRTLTLYWDDHRIVDPPPWRRLAIERANHRQLQVALAEVRPDVVSAWAMGAMSLGLLTTALAAGVPLVPVVCDEWPIYGPHVDGWTRALASRPRLARLVAGATGLPTGLPPLDDCPAACFVSDALRRTVRARSPWRFPIAPVTYSGIDLGDFPPRPSTPPWRWRLLYVGRIDPRKGVAQVIETLAACPAETTVDIVGRGDARHLAELRALAVELGVADRVRFSSRPRQEMAAAYGEADVVLFPSAWEEPFGLVPLEAMAVGTPVVATPSGGSAEFLVDGHNCVAVRAGDPVAMAHAVAHLATDPRLRDRLVAGGRATAQALTVEPLAEHLLAWHHWAAAGCPDPLPPERRLRRPLDADACRGTP